MKPIPLIQRISLYVALVLVCFVGMLIGTLYLMADPSNEEYRVNTGLVISLSFLIPHYIFGIIFLLDAKWIFKLIIPFLSAIISFGCFWLITETVPISSDILTAFIFFFPIIFVWEIAYQILKIKSKKEIEIE